MFLAVVGAAVVGPAFAPYGPAEIVGRPWQDASSAFPFGTDYVGRDVLSRVLNGGRTVVWMSLAGASLGMLLGVPVGLAAAYSRGRLDGVLMRLMDVILGFPYIVLVLLFVSVLGPKLWLIVLMIGFAWMPGVARVTRGAALEVVEREFVQSAEVIGMARSHILFRELLPNITTPLFVDYGLRLVWSIGTVAVVSFLGLGIEPPAADWGLMINENRVGIGLQPWAVLGPVLCIAIFALGANLVAEGVGRVIAGVGGRRDDA